MARPKKDKRKERVPLGVPRRRLSFADKDPGYEYRVIHNRPGKPNRVKDAEEAGYEFVLKEDDETMGDEDASRASDMDRRITHVVGADDSNRPLIGYLMRIKKKWYDEDQAKKQGNVDAIERAIMEGKGVMGSQDVEKRYTPKSGGTRIER